LTNAATLESRRRRPSGIRLTNSQFDHQLNKLYNDRTQKGCPSPMTHAEPWWSKSIAVAAFANSPTSWIGKTATANANGRV